jgi:UDP-3-O-[3-hydroxymyristoyl] N-acetylglucosamine deacetylase
VRPAFAGEGRYFVLLPPRAAGEAEPPAEAASAGLPGELRVPASAAALPPPGSAATPLRTVLVSPDGAHGGRVSTCEHLLAALEACGVDNARCELRGTGEVPVLDGSALPFASAVAHAGLATARCAALGQPQQRLRLALRRALAVRDGASFVTFSPGGPPRLAAGVHFPSDAAIGLQWARWAPTGGDASFARDVAPARTFATAAGVRAAQAAGLARGGSLAVALVCDGGEWLNPPTEAHGALRLPCEPAAHKLLDLIGDLALAARPGHAGLPRGAVTAFRSGHALHARFVAALAEAAEAEGDDAWVTETARDIEPGGAVGSSRARDKARGMIARADDA